MNDPPDQTAVLSAANLLSVCGMTVPKYSRNRSGCLLQPVLDADEDHALIRQVLLDVVVDHLRLVLGADAGQELLLGLGDAQLVEGAA